MQSSGSSLWEKLKLRLSDLVLIHSKLLPSNTQKRFLVNTEMRLTNFSMYLKIAEAEKLVCATIKQYPWLVLLPNTKISPNHLKGIRFNRSGGQRIHKKADIVNFFSVMQTLLVTPPLFLMRKLLHLRLKL